MFKYIGRSTWIVISYLVPGGGRDVLGQTHANPWVFFIDYY
jgi:hypothetical protein